MSPSKIMRIAWLVVLIIAFAVASAPVLGKKASTGKALLSAPGVQPYKGVKLRILYSEDVPEHFYEREINYRLYEKMAGVKLELENVHWSDLYPKIATMAAAGSADYDLFFIEDQWEAAFDGITEELDRFYKAAPGDLHLEDLPLRVLAIGMNKDKWKGVPGVTPLGILAYRKDLFQDPTYRAEFKLKYGRELEIPKTWEEYLQVGQFFTRDTNGDGQIDLWGFTHRYGSADSLVCDFVIGFSFSRGFRFFDQYYNPRVMTPEAIDAAKFFLGKSFMACQPPGASAADFAETMQNMAQGKVSMFLTETWAIPLLLDPKVSKCAGKIAFAPIPGWKNPRTGKIQRATFFVGNSFAINKNIPERRKWAAWDFLQYTRGKTLAKPYSEQTGTATPFRFSTLTDPKLIAKWPHFKVIAKELTYPSYTRPNAPFSAHVMFTLGKEMQAVLTGEKTVEQTLLDANTAIRKIVEEAGYYKTPHHYYNAEERMVFALQKLKELGVPHPALRK